MNSVSTNAELVLVIMAEEDTCDDVRRVAVHTVPAN